MSPSKPWNAKIGFQEALPRTQGFKISAFIPALLLLFPVSVFATVEVNAHLGFENRNFLFHRDRHGINDQETLETKFQFIYDNQKNLKIDLVPRAKVDFLDASRNRFIPNDANLTFYQKHYEIYVGLKKITWGISHSLKPTDMLNRFDLEDNYYQPEKLGEFMVGWKASLEQLGPIKEPNLELILLPVFQKNYVPKSDSRFSLDGQAGVIPYTLLNTQETLDHAKEVGIAVKTSGRIGKIEGDLYYYHGPERTPGYVLRIDNSGALRIVPFYYVLDMIGLDLSAPVGDFLPHVELAYKITTGNDAKLHDINFENNSAILLSYVQIVPGIDYTPRIPRGSLTLSLEFLIEESQGSTLQDFRPFKRDLFLGAQYALLNTLESHFRLGLIKDVSNEELAAFFETSSKIYRDLKLGFSGVLIHQDGDKNNPLSYFDNNSYLTLDVSYSFGKRW